MSPQPLQTFQRLGWPGMVDSGDLRPLDEDADRAHLLINMYPERPNLRSAALIRPGFASSTADFSAIATNYEVRLFFTIGANTYAFLIDASSNGTIYKYSASGWTQIVLPASFAAASITFQSTIAIPFPFRWVEFHGKAIIAEAPNTTLSGGEVWSFDGASVSRLTVTIGNVGVRSLAVYYAKLFLIEYGGATIIWSEENDETIGYGVGAYTNTWSLTQTSQQPLEELLGTNRALFYWRAPSIGVVVGAVTPDFTTTGVHDSISEQIGALMQPATHQTRQNTQPVLHGENIFFVDQYGRPWVYRDALIPIWYDIRRQFEAGGANRAFYEDDVTLGTASHICYCAATDQMLFWYGVDGTHSTVRAVAYDTRGLRAQMLVEVTTATGAEPSTVAYSENEQAVWLGTVNGKAMHLKLGNAPSDCSGTAQVAIRTRVVDQPIGWSEREQWHFDQVRPVVRASENTTVTIRYSVPVGASPTSTTAAATSGTGAERRLAVGIDSETRWLQVTTAIAPTAGGAFTTSGPAIVSYEADAFAIPLEPGFT